jgi:2-dehydro-3-deoxyphosphogluconate aldolase/(4S)-4-hydroxy-2-oxoglutarate aldolase
MDLNKFSQLPIMGIVRGIDKGAVDGLVDAAISSGLKTMEITMNTQNAPELIRDISKKAKNHLTVGAGTVLNIDQLKQALGSGASFIVMPTLVDDVMQYCAKNKIPAFPGAFTPQEIYNAWNAGAAMVKVFPAKFLGPEYIKEIKGPFNNIKLLACGGVNEKNIGSFFSCGASAVAFGGSIFKKDLLSEKAFDKIGNSIKNLIASYRQEAL